MGRIHPVSTQPNKDGGAGKKVPHHLIAEMPGAGEVEEVRPHTRVV
jgi:hypothetical protein